MKREEVVVDEDGKFGGRQGRVVQKSRGTEALLALALQ
jgi:hypothetical protein